MYRFIDELAKERNTLWENYRPTVHPAVVTLPQPWTRGLPIQRLLPFEIKGSGYKDGMPFVLYRAESIVFVESSFALAGPPTDSEAKDAIGLFVDDYSTALRFYSNAYHEGAERDIKVQKAWDYAFNDLGGKRMTQLEALYFWKAIFKRAGLDMPHVNFELPKRPDPILPPANDLEPNEWNPDPEPQRWTLEPREVTTTCLDSLLNPTSHGLLTEHSKLDYEAPVTVLVEQKPCWDNIGNRRLIPPKTREALIAAALLYLNSKYFCRPQNPDGAFPCCVRLSISVHVLRRRISRSKGHTQEL